MTREAAAADAQADQRIHPGVRWKNQKCVQVGALNKAWRCQRGRKIGEMAHRRCSGPEIPCCECYSLLRYGRLRLLLRDICPMSRPLLSTSVFGPNGRCIILCYSVMARAGVYGPAAVRLRCHCAAEFQALLAKNWSWLCRQRAIAAVCVWMED